MPGDYSRFTDDLRKRFSKLLMQQGRVQLDADWNEAVDIMTRRDRLQAFDTFGAAAVPRQTSKDGFRITALPGDLNIGAGRIYVEGVLAEAFDNDGKNPAQPLTYKNQPFFIDQPAYPAGKGMLYLDIWERELTSVEEPSLLEPALGGVDTSTRMQTVWQVKFAANPATPFDCESKPAAWAPSDCRLTVDILPPKDDPDPCQLPETGGFQDVENRHYRVEIHDASSTPPTFKFARDPVVTEIDGIDSTVATTPVLRVRRTGRDPVLGFVKNDYAEVVNDRHVLHNLPGIIVKVDFVDEALQEVTVTSAGTGFPLPAAGDVTPDLHPRLIRWDQKSPLLAATGTVALEVGIQLTFSGGTLFHNGDYWTFPARAINRTVGPLVNALPRGIVHHYAPLALFDSAASPAVRTDCRTLWPCECDCECAACVNPESHNTGRYTIQMAIDEVKKKGGGKICLKPGTYFLQVHLEIRDTGFLTLVGHGVVWLVYTGTAQQALLIQNCSDIVVEGITLSRQGALPDGTEGCAIVVRDCLLDVTIRDCIIWTISATLPSSKGVGVALEGALFGGVFVRETLIVANVGVGMVTGQSFPVPPKLVLARAEVADSILWCNFAGVMLHAVGLSVAVRRNWLDAGQDGVWLDGTTEPNRSIVIEDNWILARRVGMVINADQATISNNVVRGTFDPLKAEGDQVDGTFSGISLFTGPYDELRGCRIVGNRCSRLRGQGIQISGRATGLMVKQNFVTETGGAGIAVTDTASGSDLVIENNDLRNVALSPDRNNKTGAFRISAAIDVAPQCHSAIASNTIESVGLPSTRNRKQLQCAGILVRGPRTTRIHDNRIEGVFPSGGEDNVEPSAGIHIMAPVGVVEVTNNVVHTGSELAQDNAHAYALRIGAWTSPGVSVFPFPATYDVFKAAPPPDTTVPVIQPEQPPAGGRLFLERFPLERSWAYLWEGDYHWFRLALPEAAVLIRGNQFRTHDTQTTNFWMIDIFDEGAGCTFGGNVCVAEPPGRIDGVRIVSPTVVADSNQIFGSTRVSLELEPRRDEWTVLGNITEGLIRVHGKDLKTIPPWGALNRTA